jgi:hypothetical protein
VIPVGQIVRDRTSSTFKIGIVIGPSNRAGKVRVCRWQSAGKRWSPPVAMAESQLELITERSALLHHKLVISDARRAVAGGLVRWAVGGPGGLTEIADVGRTIP